MKLPKQDCAVIRTTRQHGAVQKYDAETGKVWPSTAWCEETCRYRQSYLNEPEASFQACLKRCRRN
jgi:hypothetical protein